VGLLLWGPAFVVGAGCSVVVVVYPVCRLEVEPGECGGVGEAESPPVVRRPTERQHYGACGILIRLQGQKPPLLTVTEARRVSIGG
jgi:hypothetical protein